MNQRVLGLVGVGLGAALLLLPATSRAQASFYEKYRFDALRFSQLQSNGTTRTQSMGGAGVALGADLGAFVLNPANLGSYRRSEVNFSPGLLLNSTESAAGLAREPLTGAVGNDRSNFNFANLGVVIVTSPSDASPDWRGSFGINFSRLATFSNRRTYELAAIDSSHSIQEYVVQDFYLPSKGNGSIQDVINNANDNVVNNFADLGYNTYLLNFGRNQQNQYDGSFYTPLWRGSKARQTETTTMRGAVNQIDIGYGASYRDKVYLGGSLGIVTMRYKEVRALNETLSGTTSELASIDLMDGYEVNGAGINLRIGAVYRPVEMLRLGASIQTPTFASELKEKAEPIALSTRFRQPYGPDAVVSPTASIDASEFQYQLTTPFRAMGGATLIFKSGTTTVTNSAGQPVEQGSIIGGLISADIEYVNYGQARLHAVDNDPARADFSLANTAIRREFASAVNYRVGGELRLGIFRLRGGYGFYASPYQDASRGDERQVIGGGIGIRGERSYIDIGFSRTTYTAADYRPYTLTTFGKLVPASPGNPNANPPVPPTPAYLDYYDYSPERAAEPVVRTKVTILNPTITVGFIIQ